MTKKEDKSVISNVNNNTNNVNVNVKVDHPNKRTYNKKKKNPNWVLKAIVLGVIGLVISLIGYYLTHAGEKGQPPTINKEPTPMKTNN